MTSQSATSPDVDAFHLWTLYDSPAEYPRYFVLREWVIEGPASQPRQLPGAFLARDIAVLRGQMIDKGLTCLTRSPGDDPCIVECWL